MVKKNALGKGLGALIKQSETEISNYQTNTTNSIRIRDIETNPFQPRTNFDQDALEELADSIRHLGIIQPITVREISDGKYQIISGERRYRASLIAGLEEIPAFIRHADDNNMLELALVENIQREDLDAIEVAVSYQRLIEECRMTQERISERVGKKRSTVTNYLRLLKLPAEVQLAIKDRSISMGHARTLVNIEDQERQLNLLRDILEQGLSVRQVELAVRELNELEEALSPTNEKQPGKVVYEDPNAPAFVPDTKEYQQLLSGCFGTKVNVKRDVSGAGRIVISFRTDAELQHILQMAEKMNVTGE